MSDNSQERAEAIFFEAIELPRSQRAAFLDQACRDQPDLRSLVEALLSADEAAGDANFLESQLLADASRAANAAPTPSSKSERAKTGRAISERAISGDEPGVAQPEGTAGASRQDARFRILSRYDSGGLGEVLVAHDRQLNREVAVKQIRLKWLGNEEAKERFLQEAEVTGRLEHPGIVPVYAMGTWEDGRPFYAMRFVQGMTLKQVIADYREATRASDRQAKRLQLRAILNRFVDVCNTIEYAHSRQILHRDIKPSNIMIGPYGETLVVDWGLAKLLDAPMEESMTAALVARYAIASDSSRTQIGGAVGTPQYMSPEQASGDLESIGVRTDVYLLGATLYHILTGAPPHDEASVSKLIERVKRGILRRPREVDPEVPAALEAVCMKAMATDAADRYRSASELSSDIERWMADQPVSVYRDPPSVRWGRWIRQHRTLAMSGAVAAVLITIGSVGGSTLWSYVKARQLQIEQEKNLKETQLLASRQLRLSELRESASGAMELSQREIEANRFAAALGILQSSAETLIDEPTLETQRQQLREKATRLEKIVEFYRQAELSEQFNVSSLDTQGILASSAAIKSLGIWNDRDWWVRLPDQDLTPAQQDALRWDVYQQWMMLDGMLIKTIGTRLFGVDSSGSTMRLLKAVRRLQGGAGKREAEAALEVSDRIDGFRQAEAAKWYRSVANFRLGSGRRLRGEEIGTPRNAPDAQKLGVLCMISAMDPTFSVVFRDYKGKDATTAGHDLFQRSASLRPDHYWTQIALGQMQYFMAEQEQQPTWESYQPAIQTMGRCLAINPQSCFAFADRSSLFRFQWERIRSDARYSQQEREERGAELLRWSLDDAQTAYRLGSDQPWVGWTYGMALSAAGQREKAIDVFLEASTRTFPLMEPGDATLIRADDIRGRSAAARYATELIDSDPDHPRYRMLLASIRLNQQDIDDALEQIEIALRQTSPSAHAFAIRGMIRLGRGEIDGASQDFRTAQQADPAHLWAGYGVAVCCDAKKQHDEALLAFRNSVTLATTDEHRAACLLGVARAAAFLDQYDEAIEAATTAHQLWPACDLESVAEPLLDHYKRLRQQTQDEEAHQDLREFLVKLGDLIRLTRVDFEQTVTARPFHAALLNGGFELEAVRYWSDPLGASWRNQQGYGASAEVSHTEFHSGGASLHIVGGDVDNRGQFGSTAQSFPVPAKSRCRLSLWAKAKDLAAGAFRVDVAPFGTLELTDGTFDWTEYHLEFDVGESEDPFQTTVPIHVQLISSGAGQLYLDDVAVTVVSRL